MSMKQLRELLPDGLNARVGYTGLQLGLLAPTSMFTHEQARKLASYRRCCCFGSESQLC